MLLKIIRQDCDRRDVSIDPLYERYLDMDMQFEPSLVQRYEAGLITGPDDVRRELDALTGLESALEKACPQVSWSGRGSGELLMFVKNPDELCDFEPFYAPIGFTVSGNRNQLLPVVSDPHFLSYSEEGSDRTPFDARESLLQVVADLRVPAESAVALTEYALSRMLSVIPTLPPVQRYVEHTFSAHVELLGRERVAGLFIPSLRQTILDMP